MRNSQEFLNTYTSGTSLIGLQDREFFIFSNWDMPWNS